MKVTTNIENTFRSSPLISNVGCDQFTKGIARQKIEYHEQISLIKNYLTLTKIENTGAFLSVGNNLPEPHSKTILLTICPLIILIAAFFYVLRVKHLSNLSIAGNLFCHWRGYREIFTTGFSTARLLIFCISTWFVFQTGVFNMADVSIMTGMCMILIDLYRRAVSADDTMP